jgi:hypothetical protein
MYVENITAKADGSGGFTFTVLMSHGDERWTLDLKAEELMDYERFQVVALERTGHVYRHGEMEHLDRPRLISEPEWSEILEGFMKADDIAASVAVA